MSQETGTEISISLSQHYISLPDCVTVSMSQYLTVSACHISLFQRYISLTQHVTCYCLSDSAFHWLSMSHHCLSVSAYHCLSISRLVILACHTSVSQSQTLSVSHRVSHLNVWVSNLNDSCLTVSTRHVSASQCVIYWGLSVSCLNVTASKYLSVSLWHVSACPISLPQHIMSQHVTSHCLSMSGLTISVTQCVISHCLGVLAFQISCSQLLCVSHLMVSLPQHFSVSACHWSNESLYHLHHLLLSCWCKMVIRIFSLSHGLKLAFSFNLSCV